jgi:hypothetical protein
MSHRNEIFLFIVLSILFLSCNEDSEAYNRDFWKKEFSRRAKIDFKGKNNRILKKSQAIIGEKEYWKLYDLTNQTIENYSKKNLKGFWGYKYEPWRLDSTFCINKTGDKAIFVISFVHSLYLSAIYNSHDRMLAAKVKGKWYFLGGEGQPVIKLPGQYTIENNFKFLHEENLTYFLSGYLKQDKFTNQWHINDNYFDVFIDQGWTKVDNNGIFVPKTKEDFEKRYMEINQEIINDVVIDKGERLLELKRDTLEYKKQLKERNRQKNRKWFDGFF